MARPTRLRLVAQTRSAHVLDAMPKFARPGAKKAIEDICNAEDCDHAEVAVKTFVKPCGTKFPTRSG